MIRALITGTLYGDPQARTSQAGKSFTTAKLRADAKDGAVTWCSLIAFGELAERLAGMKANNAVAVSGKLETKAYLDKQGQPAAGLSIVIDELATLKPRPKPKPAPMPEFEDMEL
jgi:single-stranded DNA-binding protein